jgi:HAMP domain-containing protein
VPVAVGATAGAVGGLANSGLVVRLTRGRLWIGALAVLLVGIVALNVMALSLNAASSKTGRQADALKQQNSALRAQLAGEVSSQKVQRLATSLGLVFPAPGDIRYLERASGDAAEAARRLRSGELTFTEPAPVAPAPITETTAPPEQTAPPAEEPVATEPAATAPTPTEPAQTAPPAGSAAGGGGGVASP